MGARTYTTLLLAAGFLTASGLGCVKQSTYEAVLQETDFTKTEIERAKEEHRLLARQVRQLEQMNAEAMRDAESTASAVQQAKDEAEKQKRLLEDQQEKLEQKISQLSRQQTAFEKAIVIAKENGAALQELVEVYQKKVRDLQAGTGSAAAPHVDTAQKPFDPATLPQAQELPVPTQALDPTKAPAGTGQEPAPPQNKPAQEPADTGWMSTIKDWLLSLWRSIFS